MGGTLTIRHSLDGSSLVLLRRGTWGSQKGLGRARCWVSEGTDFGLNLRDAGPSALAAFVAG